MSLVAKRFISVLLSLSLLSGHAVSNCSASISPSFTLINEEDCELVGCTDPAAVELMLQDLGNEPWFKEGTVYTDDLKAPNDEEFKEFLKLGEKAVSEIEKGGEDKSKKLTNWARRKFDGWRRFEKLDTSMPLEDLNMLELNKMLVKFLLQTRKKDGTLYPASSLHCLLKSIGRIIRKKQEARINATGEREARFNILKDDLFGTTRLAFVHMASKARALGIGVKKKKAQPISYSTEQDLLADIDYQITHPKGILKRLCFYLVSRFAIRGAQELYDVKDVDLSLEFDGSNEYVMYNERKSKTWGISVTRFDDSHFRPPIWSFENDYKQYTRHLPGKENDKPKWFFCQAITNFRGQVWFQKSRVGKNNLAKWITYMGSLLDIGICNKSGRVSAVTRMSLGLVPPEIGKLVTGHRTTTAYEKYDRSKEIQVNVAMNILSKPYNEDGSLRLYPDVLNEMIKEKEKGLMGNHSSKVLVDGRTSIADNVADVHDHTMITDNVAAPTYDYLTAPVKVPVDLKTGANKSVIQVSGNTVKPVTADDFDNDMLEEMIRRTPSLAKYFPGEQTIVQNYGGQSFVGATFNNCTFVLASDAEYMKRNAA